MFCNLNSVVYTFRSSSCYNVPRYNNMYTHLVYYLFIYSILRIDLIKPYCECLNQTISTLQQTKAEYYKSLSSESQTTPLPPVFTLIHNDSSQKFLDNLTHYRNNVYNILDDNTYICVQNAVRVGFWASVFLCLYQRVGVVIVYD